MVLRVFETAAQSHADADVYDVFAKLVYDRRLAMVVATVEVVESDDCGSRVL